jgi:hypothetical protein
MTDWREWTLDRGMQPPVSFIGEFLVCNDGIGGTSLWNSLVGGGRWHAISVFRTQEGRHVVYICYRSKVKGELENREVFWCDNACDIPTVLNQYQEVAMPVIAERLLIAPDKRQRAALDILARYQRQVAVVLAGIPGIQLKLS